MSNDTTTVVYREGHLCIRYSYDESDRPIRHVLFWSFGPTRPDIAEQFEGKAVRSDSNGVYHIQTYPYSWVRFQLPEGGSTKARWMETEEIPMPKVRKGIETRYYAGRWQKYLKSHGWVWIEV